LNFFRRATPAALALALAFAVTTPAAAATTKKKAKKPAVTARAAPRKPAPKDSAPPIDVGNPREAQVAQTAERDRLTARIAELRRQIAAGERSKTGAVVALKRAERALADVNRRIAELARRQHEGEERVAGLERQRTGAESQITLHRALFARTANLMDATHARREIADRTVEGRDATFLTELDLAAVATSENRQLDALHGRVHDLASARQRADDDNRALLAQVEAQRNTRDTIAADQAAQQKALQQLALQLAEQRKTADALAADEKRLSRVVEQLQRVIDRQAAEERARRETAAKKGEPKKGAAPRKSEPERVENAPELVNARGAFAQLRGQLRLPVRGTIVGRYGAPRGTSGATWKGVFVKTEPTAEVRAVAAGKVVFADDLRGFGNLLIVDHGDQFLSIYGNNAQLLRKTGDEVKAGDVVARAGDSSGDGETGLYFELRYQGRPFDPLSWTGGR
jgi:septal ring factor EnvC (AmiA/AmiB activator)